MEETEEIIIEDDPILKRLNSKPPEIDPILSKLNSRKIENPEPSEIPTVKLDQQEAEKNLVNTDKTNKDYFKPLQSERTPASAPQPMMFGAAAPQTEQVSYTPTQRAFILGTVEKFEENPIFQNEKYRDIYFQSLAKENIPSDEVKDAVEKELAIRKVNRIATSPIDAAIHGIKEGLPKMDMSPSGIARTVAESASKGENVVEIALAVATKPLAGTIEATMGALAVTPPGAAFVGTMTAMEELTPKAAEVVNTILTPVTTTLTKSFEQSGKEVPTWLQYGASAADFLVQTAGFLGAHKAGKTVSKKLSKKEITPEAVEQAADYIQELPPEKVEILQERMGMPEVVEWTFKENALEKDLANLPQDHPLAGAIAAELIETKNNIETKITETVTKEAPNVLKTSETDFLNQEKVQIEELMPTLGETGRSVAEKRLSQIDEQLNPKIEKDEKISQEKSGEETVKTEEGVLETPESETKPAETVTSEALPKTPEEIAGIEEGNKIAQENGFKEATHLRNAVAKATGEKPATVQETTLGQLEAVRKGKEIEPNKEVKADAKTVTKELGLTEGDAILYEKVKDISKEEPSRESEDYNRRAEVAHEFVQEAIDNVERIETEISLIERNESKLESEQSKILNNKTYSKATRDKKLDAVTQKLNTLEDQKKSLPKDLKKAKALKESLGGYMNKSGEWSEAGFLESEINSMVDRVSARLETRKAVKAGTDLFPEEANIPELKTKKKETIVEKTETITPKSETKAQVEETKQKKYETKEPIVAKASDIKDLKGDGYYGFILPNGRKVLATYDSNLKEYEIIFSGLKREETSERFNIKNLGAASSLKGLKENVTKLWNEGAFIEREIQHDKFGHPIEKNTIQNETAAIKQTEYEKGNEISPINESGQFKSNKVYKKGEKAEVDGQEYFVNGLDKETQDVFTKAKSGGLENQEYEMAKRKVKIFNAKYIDADTDVAAESRSWFDDKKQPTTKDVKRAMVWSYDQYGDYQIKAGGGSASDNVFVSSFKATIADPKTGLDKDVVILKKYGTSLEDVLITVDEIQKLQDKTENQVTKNARRTDHLGGVIGLLVRDKQGYATTAKGEIAKREIINSLVKEISNEYSTKEINDFLDARIKSVEKSRDGEYVEFDEKNNQVPESQKRKNERIVKENKKIAAVESLREDILNAKSVEPLKPKSDASKIKSTEPLGEQPIREESTRSKGSERVESGNEGKEVTGAGKEEKITEAAKKLADKIRKGKINRPDSFQTNTPASIVWDLALETVAKTVELTGDVAQAVADGLKVIRESEWYKGLAAEKKAAIESDFSKSIESDPFIREPGKKSLAGRVYEGKTPEEIKASVEKNGLTYEIEGHPEAELKAQNFIDDVGIDNALQAVKNGEITGGTATMVRIKAIDEISKQRISEPDPIKKAELLKKEIELIDQTDKIVRERGRETSILQYAYQTSDFGYKLGTILSRAEQANLGKEIPAEVTKKLTELSEQLDEANRKLAESEKKLKEEPKIIIEEPKVKIKKSSLTPEKAARKQELSSKYRGVLNDVTRIITLIGEKDFREYSSLVLEEMGGDFKNFSREMINTVGKGIREHLPKLYKELGGKENPQIDAIQQNLKKQISEYERKLREKDFTRKKKGESPTLDEETFNLQVERNKLKDQVDLEIEKIQLKNRPVSQKISDGLIDILNLPKSLKASADMSAPLRQGAVLSVKHPIIAGRSAREMFRQAFSEKKATDWLARLKASSEYAIMKKAGLYFAEQTAKLSAKEEQFISNIAHKIPVWGRVIKGSERAYTGYLNKLRADVFAQFHDALVRDGFSGEKLDAELKSFADFVNNASGRGNLGRFEGDAPLLNTVFFSPRYVVSRFNLLNPVKYMKMSPRARMEALKTVGTYIGVASMVLYLAQAGGAKVELDPRSADFGKIKIGNTRYDILAGFQQFVRLISQLYSGEKKSVSGKVTPLGEGYKADTRLDILGRFGRTKLSPSVGALGNILSGGKNKQGEFVSKDLIGNEVTLPMEALNLVIPLWQSDLLQIAKEEGASSATGAGVASFFGVGVQNYDVKQKSPFTPSELKEIEPEEKLSPSEERELRELEKEVE